MSRPSLTVAFLLASALTASAVDAPDFGPNVWVVDPSTPNLQARCDALFAEQERAQFGARRTAVLFKPGRYELDVRVGFYTQVAGLGRNPDDVHVTGAVRSTARWMRNNNATCNFWRCVENLSVTPTMDDGVNLWAVSQATALRRVHVRGSMRLSDGGWSSGGFIADCRVDGSVDSGSQQQWLSRNSRWAEWKGGGWNMVFVGVENAPAGRWPDPPYTVIDQAPIVAEKPFLTVDNDGRYSVALPPVRRAVAGPSWPEHETNRATFVPLDRFHLARSDRDTAATLNAALSAGRHLLLAPGIYRLDAALEITHPDTIILGLGYATLLAENASPALLIGNTPGVRVAGVLIDAGPVSSPVLVRVGTPGAAADPDRPIVLQDLFCRVGGAQLGRAACMVEINTPQVIGDNFWLWRADHGQGVAWDANTNAHGLIVDGDAVTIYGLFVEHTQKHQTLWNANGGRVFLYQSEFPYDPPSQEAWSHHGRPGFASYKVAPHVTSHEAWGLGVYAVFFAAPVVAENAIEAPDHPDVRLHHMVTLWLNGKPGSGIQHVLNGRGGSVLNNRDRKVSRLER